eukprot:TRINITY_DN19701_c0_g1_i1.p1 TRINITY_DN19701_c0_g1~~TRINITY_DN19701_c0_g1_i1.p1  ORF type:complete len:466 (+),score=39.87 TRINITY_DN19701_c0_g1_i1:122-1519(+)
MLRSVKYFRRPDDFNSDSVLDLARTPGRASREPTPDRFLPSVSKTSFAIDEGTTSTIEPGQDFNEFLIKQQANNNYSSLLRRNILAECSSVLNYAGQSTTRGRGRTCSPIKDFAQPMNRPVRRIAKLPYKVLDAPGLIDDFYLNLLDWSNQNNIAVALDQNVYVWNAANNKAKTIFAAEDDAAVTSLRWSQRNSLLAIGLSDGSLSLWDAGKDQMVSVFNNLHFDRVGAIAWASSNVLFTGSRDTKITELDIRVPGACVAAFCGHSQEVCGMEVSADEAYLASGGNDNKVLVWSVKESRELTRFSQHSAAVKAVAWSPHAHHVLATGGGTQDRCVRFWNVNTLTMTSAVDTGAQICNMMFASTANELVTTHGFSCASSEIEGNSQGCPTPSNSLAVWRVPGMTRIATLTGHTSRVLFLASSPCGQNVVTGAGDETLRFWNIFPERKGTHFGREVSPLTVSSLQLR